jgi:hypothetical protein
VPGLIDAGLQRGQERFRLFGRGARLLGIERRRKPGLQPPLRDLQRLELGLEVVLGDHQARLQAAQRDVVERHFGRDRHLDVAEGCTARAERGFARLQGASIFSEDVELPARIEAGAEAVRS